MTKKLITNILRFFSKKPFFTAKQANEKGLYPALLGYYVKKGQLKRLRRGVYQHIDAPAFENFQWEDLVEAVSAIPGGIICLISALAIYGLTEEIPRQHWIAIRHSTSCKNEKTIKVVRHRNITLGSTKIKIDQVSVPIFDRERTIVDAFRLLSIETAMKALKKYLTGDAKNINLLKLQEYAEKLRVDIKPYLLSFST